MSFLLIEVLFEGIEAAGPELAVGAQPAVDLCKRLGVERVPATLGVAADLDEPSLAQDSQVLADAGLAQADLRHQLTDRAFPLAQQVQDVAPHRLGHQLERGCHGSIITSWLYSCQGMHSWCRSPALASLRRRS